jgi:hypothetical protein
LVLPIMRPLTRSSLYSFLGRICIDLDDFDRIVDLLRRHCRSVQIVAHDVLIKDVLQLQRLRDSLVRDLEIEAHEPLLRIRFGTKEGTGSDVVSDPNDSVVASLRAQIEAILMGARRRGLISILAGFTGNERKYLIPGLIVGLITTLLMVVLLLFLPNAPSQVIHVGAVTLVIIAPIILVPLLMPCAPVLLLQRGRVTGRTKLEPKPVPIAEL